MSKKVSVTDKNNIFLSIIIPVYNEETNLKQMFDALFSVEFPSFVKKIEYIAVNDASIDNSLEILEEIAREKTNFKIITHKENKGKGEAVHTGIKASEGNVIIIQDADLELTPKDIVPMLQTMHDLDVDFVNGSRYLQGIARPMASYWRYLGNKFFSFLTSLLLNVRITDIACGYKLFTREIYDALDLKEKGFGFEAEFIIKALEYKKNNVAEVPVNYFPRNSAEGKKLTNLDALKILKTIFKYAVFKRK